jgi:hemerythrin superfamily protein
MMIQSDELIEMIRKDHAHLANLVSDLQAATTCHDGRVRELVLELNAHRDAEEVVLCPAVRTALGDAAAEQLLRDHEMLGSAMLLVQRHPYGDPSFDTALSTVSSVLRLHVSDEEATLLPRLREAVGSATIRELGRRYDQAKVLQFSRFSDRVKGNARRDQKNAKKEQ